MSGATRKTFNRFAMVFDFDGTLAEDSYDLVLQRVGQDPAAIREQMIDPLVKDGWEGELARLYTLTKLRVTRADLEAVGRSIDLYEGVEALFDRLRRRARERVPDVEVEFYLLSAGIGEVVRATSIAHEFTKIWACEHAYDDNGCVAAPRKVVTHAEKANYLLQISRGAQEVQGNPPDPWGDIPEDELHVPLEQIVYVGDGLSDMPAFALINERGGVAIGIAKGRRWDMEEQAVGTRRVDVFLEPDYRGGSPLCQALELSVDMITARIALRRLSSEADRRSP